MAYSKRFPGGFVDLPTKTTPIDSAFLNAVEAALLKLLTADGSADGQVLQWINASSRFGPALLLNSNVDPAAGIVKSKLNLSGANGIVDADIAGAAAIARSKLNFGSGLVNADIATAAAIAASKLASYPTDKLKALLGDGTWNTPWVARYRKGNNKQVINSATPTDLLNGEFTLAANDFGGVNGAIRLKAHGIMQNATGGALNSPIWTVTLGGTTIVASGSIGGVWASNAASLPWEVEVIINNRGATNSQYANMRLDALVVSGGPAAALFGTGVGITEQRAAVGGYSFIHGQGYNTSAKDTTTSLALQLLITNPTTSSSQNVELDYASLEVL